MYIYSKFRRFDWVWLVKLETSKHLNSEGKF